MLCLISIYLPLTESLLNVSEMLAFLQKYAFFTLKQQRIEASLFFFLGELDIQLLTLLQSTHPSVVITADIVEVSSGLTDNFKGIENLNHFGLTMSKFVFFSLPSPE